jgi:alpha/beta superfamily hydrolase
MSFSKTLLLNGEAGKLEAIFNPVSTPKFLAVVCHPHPLYQGTMHNKVVVTAARALHGLGGAVLRFNFRGVMASEGHYANGIGEQQDVKAAVEYLIDSHKKVHVPIVVAGFSFGAWVGLTYGATDSRVTHLIGIGLPTRLFEQISFAHSTKPKLFIHGTADTIASFADFQAQYAHLSEPKTLRAIDGADHFFTGKLHLLEQAIHDWMNMQLLTE